MLSVQPEKNNTYVSLTFRTNALQVSGRGIRIWSRKNNTGVGGGVGRRTSKINVSVLCITSTYRKFGPLAPKRNVYGLSKAFKFSRTPFLIDHTCCLGNLLFRHSSVLVVWLSLDFPIKKGVVARRTASFLLLSQLIKPLLTMKFAFALLPFVAALRFVEAGPVAAEGLVCASIFHSQFYRAYYYHVVDQPCPRSRHKARLWWGHFQVHCILGNNSRNPVMFPGWPWMKGLGRW